MDLIITLIIFFFIGWGILFVIKNEYSKKPKKTNNTPRRENGQFKRKVPVYSMYNKKVDYFVWL
jgi:hypothetical protein